MGCGFCLTGEIGFKRNLKAYEIVDQIITVMKVGSKKFPPRTDSPEAEKVKSEGQNNITNIVFMGMGEPLLNIDEVAEALQRITELLGFSKRRITLSTCGIAPKIAELYKKAPHVNLAISLNATTDDVRSRLMPVNKKYPIKVLLDACRRIHLSQRDRITFEYVMIGGVNDTSADARRLVTLLMGIPSMVNLIPFNPYEESRFKRPSEDNVLAFQKVLIKSGINTFIRKSKGRDILAACGQLRAVYKAN